jgi:hypothetical protein
MLIITATPLLAPRMRSLSIYIGHKFAVGIQFEFFKVVGKFIVIPCLAQPDMSYCLQARRLIEGTCRNVNIGVSPGVPEKAAATLFAETAIYIGRLIFDGTIPLEAALFHEF